ncbi:hypothetical protein D3C78_873650 [compost metagenome]
MKPYEKCMKGGQPFDKSRGEPRPKADARSCTQAPLGAGNTLVHKAGAVAAGGYRAVVHSCPRLPWTRLWTSLGYSAAALVRRGLQACGCFLIRSLRVMHR